MSSESRWDHDARRAELMRELAQSGIASEAVLEAMGRVCRHRFVGPGCESLAYRDSALPISCGQTVSQPFVVATMTELALCGKRRLGRALEIGTGSGYQCAVLAAVCDEVYSIERIEALYRTAAESLRCAGAENVRLRCGDGREGWPDAAPFDAIVVTAAAVEIAPAWLAQLADPGVLVAPVGGRGAQELVEIRKAGGNVRRRNVYPVVFVPLLEGVQS